jgi:hypothetical protein
MHPWRLEADNRLAKRRQLWIAPYSMRRGETSAPPKPNKNSADNKWIGSDGVFKQLLTPIGDNLLASFLVASVPILVVLVMLGALRRPAWQASLGGLAAGLVIAILGAGVRLRRQRRGIRPVAGDVDRAGGAAGL